MNNPLIIMPWYIPNKEIKFDDYTVKSMSIDSLDCKLEDYKPLIKCYLDRYISMESRLENLKIHLLRTKDLLFTYKDLQSFKEEFNWKKFKNLALNEENIKSFGVIISDNFSSTRDKCFEDINAICHIYAFSTLVNRDLRRPHDYIDFNNFKVFIHKSPKSTSYTTQRIGSTMNTLVGSARNIKYIKPTYITSTPKGCGDNQKSIIETNNDLAHSLWKLYKSKDKFWLENIYPAIVSFNKANTLSDNALDIGQTIQNLFSSIEKLLLGNKHGLRKILINLKENQPVELLKSALSSETYRLWKTDTYEYKEMKVDKKIELDSIFLIWIKELLNLRNDFAHGKINSSKSIHWNEGEHMFLATVLCQELITQTATKKPSKVLKNFEKLLAKKSIFEDEQGKSGYSDFILELMLESSE